VSTPSLARWVALPVGVLAVSTSGILIRLTTAAPLVTAAHRMLWSAAILLVVALLAQRGDLRRIDRRSLTLLAGSGMLVALHFALWTSSLFWTSVASAVLLTDTHPALDAVTARVLLGEPTPAAVWAGIATTLLGTVVIAGGDVPLGARALLGDAMALGASLTFAGYLVIGRRVRQTLGIAAYAGIVYGIAGVVIAAVAVSTGLSLVDFSARDGLLYLGLVLIPTLAGHTVFNWALRYVPVSVVGVAVVGEPVMTTLWAWLLLAEPPATTAILGGAVTLAGIFLALRTSQSLP